MIALSDTTGNHPVCGEEAHPLGNVCVFERSHSVLQGLLNVSAGGGGQGGVKFPKDEASFCVESGGSGKVGLRGLRQFHLAPGDVLLCNENLAFKEAGMPNLGLDPKYFFTMHVCHQY